jgi:endoglucanase
LSWRESFAIGQPVRVLARSGTIPGVISSATGHLAMLMLKKPDELTWNDIRVDSGLTAEELKACGVTPGTRVIWDAATEQFGSHIVGKALDNRGSLAILTELLRQLSVDELQCDLSVTCTIQEEIYLVGIREIAEKGDYDAAIVLEVGLCSDIPGISSPAISVKMGGGPILVHKDSMIHYDTRISNHLEKLSQDSNLPIQHAVFGWFGTEGSPLMRAGIPTSLLAFPTRYTHTPFETADIHDMEALLEWVKAFLYSDLSWLACES